jgi:hypothetical protein
LENSEDIVRRNLPGGMNIDYPSYLRIDNIIEFHNIRHDPDHFIQICIVKIEDEPRTL